MKFRKTAFVLLCSLLSVLLAACGTKTTITGHKGETTTENQTTVAPTTTTKGETTTTFDYSKFKNLVDIEDAAYKFDFEEIVTPYYLGNVIYNETVLLIDDGKSISGNLQYDALKILSIRDYTWKNEYSLDLFEIEGNKITLKDSSSNVPYLTKANLNGDDLPEKYKLQNPISDASCGYMPMGGTIYTESDLYYGHQISVSYVYDVRDIKLDEFASYETSGLTKTKEKLSKSEDLKIVAIGDSVMEGCSSSKKFNHEPYLDMYIELFKQGLEAKYDSNITLKNLAVGGKTSDWGSADAQIQNIIKNQPDVVYIHFGINDLGAGSSPNGFQENMETLILSVQAALPDCEFVIIKAFAPNPVSYNLDTMAKYWRKMDELGTQIDNVYTLDMFTLSKSILERKSYYDTCANGINHINDYTTRLYAMNLLAQLIEY